MDSYLPVEQQDDGFELFESRAICRYLATLGSGPELIPTDPKARAKFEQAASIEYSQFDPTGFALLWERVIKQYIGQTTNEERFKELLTQLDTKLDGYEAILRKQKYLAGDVRAFKQACAERNRRSDELFVQEVTLADLLHIPLGNVIFDQFAWGDLEKHPNVQRQVILPSPDVQDF